MTFLWPFIVGIVLFALILVLAEAATRLIMRCYGSDE